MRERRIIITRCYMICGITPAYAGKTVKPRFTYCCPWDHPRVCGKDCRIAPAGLVCAGITPAYAGKTATDAPDCSVRSGSPPRMRERLLLVLSFFSSPRITPAYAGKTCNLHKGGSGIRDHPRVCGKDLRIRMPSHVHEGSPPRMRERH